MTWQPIETAPKDGTSILSGTRLNTLASPAWYVLNIHVPGAFCSRQIEG
jgi:hypothetical protein